MEINNTLQQITIPIDNSEEARLIQGTQNISGIEETNDQTTLQTDSSSYDVELQNNGQGRSTNSQDLSENLNKLQTNELASRSLDQQQGILSNINVLVTRLQENNNSPEIQVSVEAQLQDSIQQYNQTLDDLNSKFQSAQEDTNSVAYFDGIIGARPYTPDNITKALETQQTQIDSAKAYIQEQNKNIREQVQVSFEVQRQEIATKSPYNPEDFSNGSFNTQVGNITSVQGNANLQNAQRLLS